MYPDEAGAARGECFLVRNLRSWVLQICRHHFQGVDESYMAGRSFCADVKGRVVGHMSHS